MITRDEHEELMDLNEKFEQRQKYLRGMCDNLLIEKLLNAYSRMSYYHERMDEKYAQESLLDMQEYKYEVLRRMCEQKETL